MNDELQMNAYYYSFESTGCLPIDKILSAVAVAGKRYHYTESWEDKDPGEDSCIDVIQKVASESAQRIKELEKRLAILEAAVALHSFDEFPVGVGRIEYCDSYGTVDCGWFNKKNKKYSSRTADQMREAGYIGWRYPVADFE